MLQRQWLAEALQHDCCGATAAACKHMSVACCLGGPQLHTHTPLSAASPPLQTADLKPFLEALRSVSGEVAEEGDFLQLELDMARSAQKSSSGRKFVARATLFKAGEELPPLPGGPALAPIRSARPPAPAAALAGRSRARPRAPAAAPSPDTAGPSNAGQGRTSRQPAAAVPAFHPTASIAAALRLAANQPSSKPWHNLDRLAECFVVRVRCTATTAHLPAPGLGACGARVPSPAPQHVAAPRLSPHSCPSD